MEERLKKITRYIFEQGFASPEELAGNLKVAAITVRRDLVLLEKRGAIKRVHGGAIPVAEGRAIQHISQRLHKNTDAKHSIAEKAASLVDTGAAVFVDAGSTCYYAAEQLPKDRNITVITHSLDVINMVRNRTGIKLVAVGGEYNEALNAFVGPIAEANFRTYNADISFIGASGIDIKQGCTNNTAIEKALKMIMAGQSAKSYVLADSSKFGVVNS
jgi:DeoR/GlpR family transcriptional regulator of sugar metabolism